MSNKAKGQTISLTGKLLLSALSGKKFPDISTYSDKKIVNVENLTDIDSAGIAYLAQIKSTYADLSFVGLSDKILVLAHLYGLSFIFKS